MTPITKFEVTWSFEPSFNPLMMGLAGINAVTFKSLGDNQRLRHDNRSDRVIIGSIHPPII